MCCEGCGRDAQPGEALVRTGELLLCGHCRQQDADADEQANIRRWGVAKR